MNEKIKALESYIKENNLPIMSLALVGEDIGEINIQISPANRCQDSYSVAKAFTVTAFGLAYDRKLIKPEDHIADILAKHLPSDADPRWHNITCHHALKHRIGMPGGFLDIDCFDPREFGRDYLGYMFAYPFEHEPGVEAVYTDATFYMLARAIEEVCGKDVTTLLWENILFELGYTEFAWSCCPMGHPMGGTGLYVTSLDMAKLGELYRRGGEWNGKRLLSREWCDLVIEREYELSQLGIRSMYGKGGMYGQMLGVIPDKRLSFAWHAYELPDTYPVIRKIDEIF